MGYTTLVTGASRGIGRAIAERLAREGHSVVNFSRTHPGKDFPGLSYSVDLDDDEALRQVLKRLTDERPIDNLSTTLRRAKVPWSSKSKWPRSTAWSTLISARQFS